jgi:hypothetical protein
MANAGPSPAKRQKKNAAGSVTDDASSSKPVCQYGANCYRKNPQHLKDFSHPNVSKKDDQKPSNSSANATTGSAATASSATSSVTAAAVAASKLPPCKYGAHCYRKNLLHFTQFSHPAAPASTDKDDSDATDVFDSDDEEDGKAKKGGKKMPIAGAVVRFLLIYEPLHSYTIPMPQWGCMHFWASFLWGQ